MHPARDAGMGDKAKLDVVLDLNLTIAMVLRFTKPRGETMPTHQIKSVRTPTTGIYRGIS